MAKTKKNQVKRADIEAEKPVVKAEPGIPADSTPSPGDLPSSEQLVRSTVIAAAVAAVLLVVAVLPAEYGVDPTGIGRLLGLTPMGELKVQLAREAAAHSSPGQPPVPVPSSPNNKPRIAPTSPPNAPPQESAVPAQQAKRSDVTKVTLAPNQAIEVKLAMSAGGKAEYSWTTEGGGVNFDLHADRPGGVYHGYKKGKEASSDKGELVAAFDGLHGWFWRNKSASTVTITLQTTGDYSALKELKP